MEEKEILNRVKQQLIEYMVLTLGNNYKIEIPADKWHEIFKTEENK